MRLRRWVPLFFLASMVSGDLTINVLCLSNSSVFPVAAYDAIVQRISNSTLASPSTMRPDSITGAEAMQQYFVGRGVVFRRFELVHVTRVQTILPAAGSVESGKLMLDLTRTVAISGVGVCGVDGIVDSALGGESSSNQSWFLNMPALVAPVALVGWIVTLLSCCVCWVCVCCLEDKSVRTVSQVVLDDKPPSNPVSGIPIGPPPPREPPKVQTSNQQKTQATPLPSTANSNASKKTPQSKPTGAAAPFVPPLAPPTPFNRLSSAVEFHPTPNHRTLDLRIPSFT